MNNDKVFMLYIEEVNDGDVLTTIKLYKNKKCALIKMKKLVEENEEEINKYDTLENYHCFLEAYNEGWYNDNHILIYIREMEVL